MTLFGKLSTYDERSARLAGIGLMLLSVFMFSFGDALGKFMVASYSVGQLLWLRACAALIVLMPMIWRNRADFARLERPWLQLLRVLLSSLEVAGFFLATVYLPLAPASVVVPYQYSMIVWAVMFGYLIFGDVPSPETIAGAAIIIDAGLYIFLRERKLGLDEALVSPPA